MPKQEQITTHFAFRDGPASAKWGGIPMHHILELVRPTLDARYAAFYSLAEGSDVGRYYDVHRISNMSHDLAILACEMNGAPLSVAHRYGYVAKMNSDSKRRSGSRRLSSVMTSRTLAPAKADVTKIMNSMVIGCLSDFRSVFIKLPRQ